MEQLKWVRGKSVLEFKFKCRIFAFCRPQVIKGVGQIAEEKIDVLAGLWKNLFEPEIGMEHMQMLLDHVDAFFADIISETKHRELAIREKIESKLLDSTRCIFT